MFDVIATSKSMLFSTASLPMLLDGVMLLAIAGLWLMWWRNARRQRLVESMLMDSAKQLNEASGHLRQAMELIRHFSDGKASFQHENDSLHTRKTAFSEEDIHARILAMRQAGEAAEQMARELSLPLSQVKLILKLHDSRGKRS